MIAPARLASDGCQWPEGDPRAPDFRFCGCATVGRSSYCAEHLGQAYSIVPDSWLPTPWWRAGKRC